MSFFDYTKTIDSPALNEKLYGLVNPFSQVHCFQTVNVDNSIPDGCCRVISVNQKKSWEKAVRIYDRFDSDEFSEVKCGDKSGKECKKNHSLKFDTEIVKFKPDSSIRFILMKPKTFGIWGEMGEAIIKKEDWSKYHNRRNFYFFFDNDGDNYFKIDANRLDYTEMI